MKLQGLAVIAIIIILPMTIILSSYSQSQIKTLQLQTQYDSKLQNATYDAIKAFPIETYRDYCRKYKDKCLRAGSSGGKWTNASCEKMFGPSQQNGDLNGFIFAYLKNQIKNIENI